MEGFGVLFSISFLLHKAFSFTISLTHMDCKLLTPNIYREFPDYAVQFNLMEQTGGGVPLRQALNGAERPVSTERMVRLTPEMGTDFFRF